MSETNYAVRNRELQESEVPALIREYGKENTVHTVC